MQKQSFFLCKAFIVVFLFSHRCFSQDVHPDYLKVPFQLYQGPECHSGRNGGCFPVEYGEIFFEGDSMLLGMIRFTEDRPVHIRILPRGKTSAKDIIDFDENKITRVRIFDDSLKSSEWHLDFFNLSKQYCLKNYWRLLGRKNDVAIYDDFTFEHTSTPYISGGTMILTHGKECIKIYHYGDFFTYRKPVVKDFINKRYHQHFKTKDFKNVVEEIDYILDKENEITESK